MGKRYWEWEPAFPLKADACAFLIIDMQKGFVDEGAALEVPRARLQVPVIKKLADHCRTNGIPVLYSRFAYNENLTYDFYYKMGPQRGLIQTDTFNSFDTHNDETSIIPSLEPAPGDIVFDKYGYDCFGHSVLKEKLDALGVKTLIIAGTVVNWCVDSTVRSAYHQDYNVVVVADGVSGYDQAGLTGEVWERVELDHFAEAFARVMSVDDIIREL